MFKYAFVSYLVLLFAFIGCNDPIPFSCEESPYPGCPDAGVPIGDGGIGGTGGTGAVGGQGGSSGQGGEGGNAGAGGTGGSSGQGGSAGIGGSGGYGGIGGSAGIGGTGGVLPECERSSDCPLGDKICTCTICKCGECQVYPLGPGPGNCHPKHEDPHYCFDHFTEKTFCHD